MFIYLLFLLCLNNSLNVYRFFLVFIKVIYIYVQ